MEYFEKGYFKTASIGVKESQAQKIKMVLWVRRKKRI